MVVVAFSRWKLFLTIVSGKNPSAMYFLMHFCSRALLVYWAQGHNSWIFLQRLTKTEIVYKGAAWVNSPDCNSSSVHTRALRGTEFWSRSRPAPRTLVPLPSRPALQCAAGSRSRPALLINSPVPPRSRTYSGAGLPSRPAYTFSPAVSPALSSPYITRLRHMQHNSNKKPICFE